MRGRFGSHSMLLLLLKRWRCLHSGPADLFRGQAAFAVGFLQMRCVCVRLCMREKTKGDEGGAGRAKRS